MAKKTSAKKTAYSEFKEKAAYYQEYFGVAKNVQENKVVPNIHNIAAGILKRKGLDDLANDLASSNTRPDYHALYPIIQEGVDLSQKEFSDFGKNNLVKIVNSEDLEKEKVIDALLLLPPEKDIKGYEALSKMHKDASEFYRDLYVYQNKDKLSDDQKAGIVNNMKVRVLQDYHEKFKDDQDFFNKLGGFIQGYEDIAIAQYKRLTSSKVKAFTDKLNISNAGKYVGAIKFSDEQRNAFYQAILQ